MAMKKIEEGVDSIKNELNLEEVVMNDNIPSVEIAEDN